MHLRMYGKLSLCDADIIGTERDSGMTKRDDDAYAIVQEIPLE